MIPREGEWRAAPNILPRVALSVLNGSTIVSTICEETAAMANSSAPFGFIEVGHVGGAAPTYEMQQVAISTATLASGYFTGDLVAISTGGGGTIVGGGTLMVASAAGIGFEDGNIVPAGVFVGCEYYSAAA